MLRYPGVVTVSDSKLMLPAFCLVQLHPRFCFVCIYRDLFLIDGGAEQVRSAGDLNAQRALPLPAVVVWGSVMWRSWARVIHGRLPAIGRQDGASSAMARRPRTRAVR